jgi:hypothetical protein
MKYILKDIPSFHFNEEEKIEVLNDEMLKNFDGSTGFLVEFHEQLKYHYFRFQVVRSHLYNLIMKIVYAYNISVITLKGNLPKFLEYEPENDSETQEKGTDPLLRFFKDDVNFISKNFLFKILPSTESIYYKYLDNVVMWTVAFTLTFFSLLIIIIEMGIIFFKVHQLKFFDFIFTFMSNPYFIQLALLPLLLYIILSVHFFMFQFHFLFFFGIKRHKSTNLVSMLNSSSLFAYFSFPLCYNFFNMFVSVEATAFNEV